MAEGYLAGEDRSPSPESCARRMDTLVAVGTTDKPQQLVIAADLLFFFLPCCQRCSRQDLLKTETWMRDALRFSGVCQVSFAFNHGKLGFLEVSGSSLMSLRRSQKRVRFVCRSNLRPTDDLCSSTSLELKRVKLVNAEWSNASL